MKHTGETINELISAVERAETRARYCLECDCAHAKGEHIPANLRPANYYTAAFPGVEIEDAQSMQDGLDADIGRQGGR